jgi:hypothetical protein
MTNEEYRGSGTSDAKQQAREKLAEAKERTTEQVESRLTQQKSRAAETLSGVSQSLMFSSQHLRDQQQANVGRYVERAAEQVDRLARYLDTRNVSDIVHQVEDLARRQPAAFVGGAVAIGFVAARFFKSSSAGRHYPEGERDTRETYRGHEAGFRRDYRGVADVATSRTDNRW